MWSVTSKTRLHQVKPGWYNVLDFGLKNDGTTNNRTALQNLIDTVSSNGGGTLYFPPGSYYFGGNINLKAGCVLQGAGRALTTLTGGSFNINIYPVGTNVAIRDFFLNRFSIVAGSPGSYYQTGLLVLERLKFTGLVYYNYIQLYITNLNATRECGVRIQDVAIEIPSGGEKTAIVINSEEVPILLSNCSLYYPAFTGTIDAISAGGYGVTMENIYVAAFGGNLRLVNVFSGRVKISGIIFYFLYDTKTLVYVSNSSAKAILGYYNGTRSMCTFKPADGYVDNVTYLDELQFISANPVGATGLWLPTDRSTTSTSYVTLKSFRTNFSGEFRLKIIGTNNDPEQDANVRVLKNGNVVQEWGVSHDSSFTLEKDISVVRNDLIEIQAKAARPEYSIVIQDVTGRQVEYQPTLYYEIND